MPNQTDPAQEAEDFFSSVARPDIDEKEDNKSDKEQDNLFGKYTGGFKDIDVWIKHEEFRIKRQDRDAERALRNTNAERAFEFSARWSIFIAIVILLKGFGSSWLSFNLSETEFLFIIGSLTSSILLFYTLVIRYLFNKPDNKKES